MPTEEGYYRDGERAGYEFPPCPVCAGPTIGSWVRVDGVETLERLWIPGRYRCARPEAHDR